MSTSCTKKRIFRPLFRKEAISHFPAFEKKLFSNSPLSKRGGEGEFQLMLNYPLLPNHTFSR